MKKAVWLFVAALAAGLLMAYWLAGEENQLSDIPSSEPNRTQIILLGSVANDIIQTADESRIPELMRPTSTVQAATNRLLQLTCTRGTDQCKAQAIYDYVRRNYEYVERSPQHKYIQSPPETLYYGSGDALELALVLASMNRAAGFDSEILQGPYHLFVRTHLGNRSIMMDPSCQGCRFMDVRVQLRGDEKVYH